MTLNLRSENTLFSPAEAEAITGVGVAMQRDWRRRGIIQKADDGWSRYDRQSLAEMTIIKHLADAGIAPALAKDWAVWAGWRLADHALHHPNAEEVHGRELLEAFEARVGRSIPLPGRYQRSDHSAVDQRFLVVRAGAVPHLTSDLNRFFDNGFFDDDSKGFLAPGAGVVLDLFAAGYAMAQRAGRPLHVVIVEDKDAE